MKSTQSRTGTLAGGIVTTVTLTGYMDSVEVISLDGAARISYTIGETDQTGGVIDPTVDGNNTWPLPAAITSRTHQVGNDSGTPGITVKLISSGTPKYAVVAVV